MKLHNSYQMQNFHHKKVHTNNEIQVSSNPAFFKTRKAFQMSSGSYTWTNSWSQIETLHSTRVVVAAFKLQIDTIDGTNTAHC